MEDLASIDPTLHKAVQHHDRRCSQLIELQRPTMGSSLPSVSEQPTTIQQRQNRLSLFQRKHTSSIRGSRERYSLSGMRPENKKPQVRRKDVSVSIKFRLLLFTKS